MRVLIDSLKRLYAAGRLTKEQIAVRVEKGTIDEAECKESGTCAHCTNYHIPMTQYPCKWCEKLNQN